MIFPYFKKYFVVEVRANGNHRFYHTHAKNKDDALFDTLHETLKRKNLDVSRDDIAQNFDIYVEASWQNEELRRFKTAMDTFNHKNSISPRKPQPADYDLQYINEDNYLQAFDFPVSILPTGVDQYLIQTSPNTEDDFIICDPVKTSGRTLKQYPNIEKIG